MSGEISPCPKCGNVEGNQRNRTTYVSTCGKCHHEYQDGVPMPQSPEPAVCPRPMPEPPDATLTGWAGGYFEGMEVGKSYLYEKAMLEFDKTGEESIRINCYLSGLPAHVQLEMLRRNHVKDEAELVAKYRAYAEAAGYTVVQ